MTDQQTQPTADERVSAFKIDKEELLLGASGKPLKDYQHIIRTIQKMPSYEKVMTAKSPHFGSHTVLRSDIQKHNEAILTKLQETLDKYGQK